MRVRLKRPLAGGGSRSALGRSVAGVALAAVLAVAGGTGSASAQSSAWESRYSSLGLADCRTVRHFDLGNEIACPGPAGWTVIHAEADLRHSFFLLGPGALRTDSVGPGSLQFNRSGDTLEWRGRPVGSGWQPETLILRWFLEEWGSDDTPIVTQILRVFRLDRAAPGGPALCAIGTVPVADNPDHNADARAMADAAVADGFRCPPTARPEKPRTN